MSSPKRIAFALRGLLEDLVDLRFAFAVEPLIGRLEIGRIDDLADDRLADREAHRVAGVGVERIDHRHHDRVAAFLERQKLLVAQEGAPELVFQHRLGGQIARGGERDAQIIRKRVGEVLVGDHAEPRQHMLQPLAAFARDLLGTRQRIRRDLAFVEQILGETGRPGRDRRILQRCHGVPI